MKIKLFLLTAFGLFCGSIAYATPIEYIFTNASNFTLNGVSYTGPYLGLPVGDQGELTFTMQANTDNVISLSSGNLIENNVGTTTVSFGGRTLATLTDPTALEIFSFSVPEAILLDAANGDGLFSDGVLPYDGVSDFGPSSIFESNYPDFVSIDTNVGPLVITYSAYQGSFSAVLGTSSTVPEPASIVLLFTGALDLAGVLRRRLFLN